MTAADPPAIPDEVREALKASMVRPSTTNELIDAMAPIFAAHFAKERDDLQATLESIRAVFGEHYFDGKIMPAYLGALAAAQAATIRLIIEKSPSGAADRLRAEGWGVGFGTSHNYDEYQNPDSKPTNPFLAPKGTE